MTFLWTHNPFVSAPPKKNIKYKIHHDEDGVSEVAVFLLENDRFLFIYYSSGFPGDINFGLTEIEEFDNEQEAVMLYEEVAGD